MNLKSLLKKLDGFIKIEIRVKNPPPYDDHEYNCIDGGYYEWDTVFDSFLAYQSSIVDVYIKYGKYKVLRIWYNFRSTSDTPIMVIDIKE